MLEAMESNVSTPRREDVLWRVFRLSAQGIAVANLDDARILEANDAFGFLVGRDAAELIGTTLDELGIFSEMGNERARTMLRDRGGVDGFDAYVRAPSGETRVLRLWAEVVEGGEPLVVLRASDVDGRAAARARYYELREAEVRYKALVEQVQAIIYTEVDDGSRTGATRPTYVSPQSSEMLGYTPEELTEDPRLWDDLVHPDDRERVHAEEVAVDVDDHPFCLEYRIVRKDGEVRWVRDEATLVEDPASGLRFWQGLMLDITEHRRAQEQQAAVEAKYRALVERLPAVVYLGEYGEDGDWLYMSPQLERVLGYTPEEWLAHPHPLGSFTHPDDLPAVREAEERSYRTGQPFHAEYRMLTKDGRWLWILDDAAAVKDEQGHILFMQGVMYDMTDRKRAEQELARALENLRALDRLKNTLLHTLSHDLRGPLTAILGAASTLERLDNELPAGERKALLDTMVAKTKGLNTLLTDLLDLDRIDQGILEPRRFPADLGFIVRELVARTEALAGRDVHVDAGRLFIAIDQPKVERALENLLLNAVIHTPSDSRIWVRVEEREGGALLIVEDDGPGVPDDLKEVIFDAFRRGPGAGGIPGSGLGLSLVARFAELHEGRAWVEDRPGGGASFRVFLPSVPV